MKKRNLFFVTVLAIGMGMSMPAWAQEAPAETEEGLAGVLGSLLDEGGVVDSILNDSEAMEAINGLFGEGGELAGILPEDVDIEGVLQTVGDQLQDTGSSLYQGINSIAEMAQAEDGSIDWDNLGSMAGSLVDMFVGGDVDVPEDASEEDLDAMFEEIMAPYKKADAVMFDYVAQRNAEFLDAADVQIFSKKTGFMGDIEQDEVKVLAEFNQTNFAVDGDQLKLVSGAADPLLLTLTKGEDGEFTVTDEKHAEDGEAFAASLEALCEEVGITPDDYYAGTVLGAYNDVEALADYLDEHPELASAEYQGEQMTSEELRALVNSYNDELFGSFFEDEEMTEAATE